MTSNPADAERRLHYMRVREQVINRLLVLASAQASAGQYDNAANTCREVQRIDAGNSRARALLASIDTARRHQQLASDARARLAAGDSLGADLMVKAILSEDPGQAQARELDRQLRDLDRKKAVAVPVLKSRLQQPVTLEFRDAQLKLVLEALARTAGINFVLDREVRQDLKATIFVRQVRVEDALELILQNLQLDKKVLTDNTVLVYPNTPQKQREHQELVMRTFHLGNADPKQTLNLLRTMLKTKDMFVDERVNLLVMRDTPDVIRAAERLIASHDVADPEVMLELEILEVSRSKVRDLGITYPSQFAGPGSGGAKLFQIGDITTRTVNVDTGFALKLLRTDGDTKTLANPRVRVRNRDKARVHVGDRVPVISSTIVGTTNLGTSSTPVTTEQIQYLDVGIKIEAEPTIHADDTVAIHINLDVSSLGTQTQTKAGTTAYEVGTRNATTTLRLRNGETQALMGLIRDDDVQAGSGLPFIGEFPMLDRIFGTRRTEQRSRELVLLITPQLVRGVERGDASLSEFWSGTEAQMRTRSPFVETVGDAAAGSTTTGTMTGITGTTAASASAAPGATGVRSTTLTLDAGSVTAPPMTLSWQTPDAAKAGEVFVVTLQARSEAAIKGATLQLRYDTEQIEVLGVDDGGYFDSVGGRAVFTPRIDPRQGAIYATLGATGAASRAGAGAFVKLRLRALKPASRSSLQLTQSVAVDAANRRVPIEGAQVLELRSAP
ncbi:MAG: type II and III secretion system protein [Burkholderiales bacterium]|nr:type II and III secretion system protein [Burkholderiales bacterium]